MDRRSFLKNFPKGIIIGAVAVHAFKSNAESVVCETLTKKPRRIKDPTVILKEIYKEVVELGGYDNEDFIKREFLMNIDNNDWNEEEHVVVLIHKVGDREKMVVQVTYFGPIKNFSKYAKEIKMILCYLKGNKLEIEKCDYSEKEIKSLLPDILQGIRLKKKLLKLLDRGQTSKTFNVFL